MKEKRTQITARCALRCFLEKESYLNNRYAIIDAEKSRNKDKEHRKKKIINIHIHIEMLVDRL